jgi:hypothetical protein
MPTASVGRDVHYRSFGSKGGKYPPACRTAKVTEVDPDDPHRVGLCVFNPDGLFIHSLASGGIRHDAGDPPAGGTWHWPEPVSA